MGKTCSTCGQAVPTIQGLVVDDSRGEVRFAGKTVHLTSSQHRVFSYLANNPGRCVSKGNIADAIYFDHRGGEQPLDKIIDVFICKLRPLVAPLGLSIKTRWGRGYELEVPGLASKESEIPMGSAEVADLSFGAL